MSKSGCESSECMREGEILVHRLWAREPTMQSVGAEAWGACGAQWPCDRGTPRRPPWASAPGREGSGAGARARPRSPATLPPPRRPALNFQKLLSFPCLSSLPYEFDIHLANSLPSPGPPPAHPSPPNKSR